MMFVQDKVDEVLNKVKLQVDEVKAKVMGLIPVKAAEKTE